MKLPDYIKGAIFDMDGTLLDSLGIWADIDNRFLSKRGIEVPSDYTAAISAMEFRETAAYTIARFGLNETPEAVMKEWSDMALNAYATEIKLKPNVKSILTELKSLGVKLAVATSATSAMCLPALQNNGVLHLFEGVFTTHEIGKGKAFPDVYLAAANKLGVPPENCAVFEDSLAAINTAKQAGFYTIGVSEKHFRSVEQEVKAVADDFVCFEE